MFLFVYISILSSLSKISLGPNLNSCKIISTARDNLLPGKVITPSEPSLIHSWHFEPFIVHKPLPSPFLLRRLNHFPRFQTYWDPLSQYFLFKPSYFVLNLIIHRLLFIFFSHPGNFPTCFIYLHPSWKYFS